MKKLTQKIVKLLSKKKLKISFAESCTGGLLSSQITSISGSSKVFTLGLVTYSNQAKINILKVPKKIIMKNGAVSYETCLSMVKKLNKISKILFEGAENILVQRGVDRVVVTIDPDVVNELINNLTIF